MTDYVSKTGTMLCFGVLVLVGPVFLLRSVVWTCLCVNNSHPTAVAACLPILARCGNAVHISKKPRFVTCSCTPVLGQ